MQVLHLGDSPMELPEASQHPVPTTEMSHVRGPAPLSIHMMSAPTTTWLQSQESPQGEPSNQAWPTHRTSTDPKTLLFKPLSFRVVWCISIDNRNTRYGMSTDQSERMLTGGSRAGAGLGGLLLCQMSAFNAWVVKHPEITGGREPQWQKDSQGDWGSDCFSILMPDGTCSELQPGTIPSLLTLEFRPTSLLGSIRCGKANIPRSGQVSRCCSWDPRVP